jgi:hypothetical protein
LSNNVGYTVASWGGCQGALFDIGITEASDPAVISSGLHKPEKFGFDASRSSQIYGKSPTVQPNSLIFNYVVKY